MNPFVLSATAAAWSLRRSWAVLSRTAVDGDLGTLRSSAPSSGRTGGGHGDPVGTAVLTASGGYHDRLTVQTTEDVAAAYWLARSDPAGRDLPPAPLLPALTRILPDVSPATARDALHHLHRADLRIRRVLKLPPDHWLLPTNPVCPGCSVRLLRVQVSAPASGDWTVVCTAGCRCEGASCGCGMPERVHGAPHIWSATTPLVAAQLHQLSEPGQLPVRDDVRDEGEAA